MVRTPKEQPGLRGVGEEQPALGQLPKGLLARSADGRRDGMGGGGPALPPGPAPDQRQLLEVDES